jgi:hypothetical protein
MKAIRCETLTFCRCTSSTSKDPGGSQYICEEHARLYTFDKVCKYTDQCLHGMKAAVEAEAGLLDFLGHCRRVVSKRSVVLFPVQYQKPGRVLLTPE